MKRQSTLLAASLLAATALPTSGGSRIIHNTNTTDSSLFTYDKPPVVGSAMGGQFARRSQRQIRKDARRNGTTVKALKYRNQ